MRIVVQFIIICLKVDIDLCVLHEEALYFKHHFVNILQNKS